MKYDCLFVDDEDLLSESAREYFNAFGVKTAWVADAKSCMGFFRDNTVGVILLDNIINNSAGYPFSCVVLTE